MNTHLSDQERESGNKRNGKGSKRLKTISAELIVTTPEDRKSTFSPQIVMKRETFLADNLAPQIIGILSGQYLLDKGDTNWRNNVFTNFFGADKGIPRYVMFDKNGRVISVQHTQTF